MARLVKLFASIAVLALVACGGDDGPTQGDSCDNNNTFSCSKDPDGNKDGVLLVCTNKVYASAKVCGDVEGCSIEGSNTQGRCFHGDGTGELCSIAGTSISCCNFVEPNLSCN